jgi:hypothetical protein
MELSGHSKEQYSLCKIVGILNSIVEELSSEQQRHAAAAGSTCKFGIVKLIKSAPSGSDEGGPRSSQAGSSLKRLPPYTLAGFDLTTQKLKSPRWQAETIPLDHTARATSRFLI